MSKWPVLALFLAVSVGGGLLIGAFTLPGEWYEGLAKPWFNPPSWVFGPAWTFLYALIAIAGWRSWRTDPSGAPMKAWIAQMVFNFLWSPTFFALHWMGAALAVIGAMLLAILAFIAFSWSKDRIAALLFLPYAAWVCFAMALNAALLSLN